MKKKSKNVFKKKKTNLKTKSPLPEQKKRNSIFSKMNPIFKRVLRWAGLVSLIIAFWQFFDWRCEKSKSAHQKFIEDKYVQLILAPFEPNDEIEICFGHGSFVKMRIPPDGVLKYDYVSFHCGSSAGGEFSFGNELAVTFKLENGYFLISTSVRDLKTGATFCTIVNNRINITKSLVEDYYSDSKVLEIIDQYGNVAFKLWVDESKRVQIRGYFYGIYCTVFTFDNLATRMVYHSDSDYLERSMLYASKLKREYVREK